MIKKGIFGGTFDPIHNGHLYIAHEAVDRLKLDYVIFMPSGNPPHKTNRKKNWCKHKIWISEYGNKRRKEIYFKQFWS